MLSITSILEKNTEETAEKKDTPIKEKSVSFDAQKLIDKLNELSVLENADEAADVLGRQVVDLAKERFDDLNVEGAYNMLKILDKLATEEDLPFLIEVLSKDTITGTEDRGGRDLCLSIIEKLPKEKLQEALTNTAADEAIKTAVTNLFEKSTYDIDPTKAFEYALDIADFTRISGLYRALGYSESSEKYAKLAKSVRESNIGNFGINPEFLTSLMFASNPSFDLDNYAYEIIKAEQKYSSKFFKNGFSYIALSDIDVLPTGKMEIKSINTAADMLSLHKDNTMEVYLATTAYAFGEQYLHSPESQEIQNRLTEVIGYRKPTKNVPGELEALALNVHFQPKNNWKFSWDNLTYAVYAGAQSLKTVIENNEKTTFKSDYMYGTTNIRFGIFAERFGLKPVALQLRDNRAQKFVDVPIDDEAFKKLSSLVILFEEQNTPGNKRPPGEHRIGDSDIKDLGITGLESIAALTGAKVFIAAKISDVAAEVAKLTNPERLARMEQRLQKKAKEQ